MKRHSSSDSLGALISIGPTTTADEHSPRNNHVYSRDFQSMLDGLDEGCVEESGHVEKKRRLSVEQVKALEKSFEVENKLEPDRKVKLAQELGLQPRQVAVWFQNRRARWKTKQLERDYGILKANYDTLKISFDSLQHDNQALQKQIKELKGKFQLENTESNNSVKEEEQMAMANESSFKVANENNIKPPQSPETSAPVSDSKEVKELNFECFHNNANSNGAVVGGLQVSLFPDFKDGSSDSDSSAILNEDQNSPNAIINHHELLPPSSSSSMNCFQFQKSSSYQPQFVKIEEHNFFSSDEACNFFSDEQAPSLQWYCQWN